MAASLAVGDVIDTTESYDEAGSSLAAAALAMIAEPLVVVDRDGCIDRVNDSFAALVGCEEEALVGRTMWDSVLDLAEAPRARALYSLDSGRRLFPNRLVLRLRGGLASELETSWTNTAVLDVSGGVDLVVSVRDRVTALAEAAPACPGIEQTVTTLALSMERRDPRRARHQLRVAVLVEALLEEIGASDDLRRETLLAAHIHDIGHVFIPKEVLNHPGQLSPPNLDLVRRHSQIGGDIARQAGLTHSMADMIAQHHERLDGSGYPDGLSGTGIVFGARLLAVADTTAAMLYRRPHRPAWTLADVRHQLRKLGGLTLDAGVVEACQNVLASGRFPMR